jgi:hypothetical protein
MDTGRALAAWLFCFGALLPRGTTVVSCTATDASGNESACEFSVTVRPKTRERRL